MINVFEMFLQLEAEDKEKCVGYLNNVFLPIKIYVILIVILLFLIFLTNLYLITKS